MATAPKISVPNPFEEVDELTHYTDLSGFMGIVGKGTFWLSHAAYLNDPQELQYGIKAAASVIERFSKSEEPGEDSEERIELLKNMTTRLRAEFDVNAYVTCFCEEDDLLSQWRGYSAQQGISITFDAEPLNDAFSYKGAEIHKVQYGVLRSRTQIRRDFAEAFPDLLDDFEYVFTERTDKRLVQELMAWVRKLAPRFKHSAFNGEKEWRLISHDPDLEIDHRVKGQLLLPYIKLKADGPLPIKKVTIGPGVHDEAVARSVRFFLVQQGYDPEMVVSSRIPYRT